MIKDIMFELFKSKEIANHIADSNLKLNEILEIIAKAPVSLKRKKEFIELIIENRKNKGTFEYIENIDYKSLNEMWRNNYGFLSYKNKGEKFSDKYLENAMLSLYLNEINFALSELGQKENEVLLFNGCFVNEQGEDDDFTGKFPIMNMEEAKIRMAEELTFLANEEGIDNFKKTVWFEIKKWKHEKFKEYCFPEKTGYRHCYTYTILPNQNFDACYFNQLNYDERKFTFFKNLFAKSEDIGATFPFKAGDICITNCYPFINEKYFVLAQNGAKEYYTSPFVIYFNDGKLNYGRVKYNCSFDSKNVMAYSCLYNLEKYEKELPKNQKILKIISECINGDEQKGKDLIRFISSKYSNENGNIEFEKIIEFMQSENK